MEGEDPDKDKVKKEVMDNCSESRTRVHKKNMMTNRQKLEILTLLWLIKIDFYSRKEPKKS